MESVPDAQKSTNQHRCHKSIRSAVGGSLSTAVLLGLLFALCAPFWWVLTFWSFDTVLLLDAGLTSMIPWITVPLFFFSTAFGGYVARSRLCRGRGILQAALQILFLIAVLIPLAYLRQAEPRSVLRILALLPVGGLGYAVGTWWAARKASLKPVGWRDWAWPMAAMAGLPFGLSLMILGALSLALWRQQEFIDLPQENDVLFKHATDASAWPAYALMASGLVLISLYVLRWWQAHRSVRRMGGMPWLCASLVLAIALAWGFVQRHAENRPDIDNILYQSTFFAPQRDEPSEVVAGQSGAESRLVELAPSFYQRTSEPIPASPADVHVPGREPSTEALAWLNAHEQQFAEIIQLIQNRNLDLSFVETREVAFGLGVIADTLCAYAQQKAFERDIQSAIRYLGAARTIARGLSSPSLGLQFASLGIDETVLQSTRDILGWGDLTADEVHLILASLTRWSNQELLDYQDWREAVMADRKHNTGKLDEALFQLRCQGNLFTYLTSQFISRDAILDAQKQTIQTCLNEGQWQSAYRCFDHLRSRTFLPGPPTSWSDLWQGELRNRCLGIAYSMCGYQPLPERLLENRARRRILRGYALAYGELRESAMSPAELSVWLTPQLPPDPFGETTLRLRADDTAIVIYSVGTNGQDDTGQGYFSTIDAQRAREQDNAWSSSWEKDISIKFPHQMIQSDPAEKRGYVRGQDTVNDKGTSAAE